MTDKLHQAAQKAVAVIEMESDYWSRGHFYEGKRHVVRPTANLDELPIGTPLFALQHQEVPSASQWFEDSPGIANHDWRGGWDACRNRCRELLEIAASGIAQQQEAGSESWPEIILMVRAWFEGDPNAALAELEHRALAAAPSTPSTPQRKAK